MDIGQGHRIAVAPVFQREPVDKAADIVLVTDLAHAGLDADDVGFLVLAVEFGQKRGFDEIRLGPPPDTVDDADPVRVAVAPARLRQHEESVAQQDIDEVAVEEPAGQPLALDLARQGQEPELVAVDVAVADTEAVLQGGAVIGGQRVEHMPLPAVALAQQPRVALFLLVPAAVNDGQAAAAPRHARRGGCRQDRA